MATDKNLFEHRLVTPQSRSAYRYAITLWLLTGMFALRVLGQAIQYWYPQSYLPPFNAFQGSRLPYWALLAAQLAILAVMTRFSLRVQTGALIPNRKAGNILGWFGVVYMLGSLSRILVGVLVPSAPAWFSTWIPAMFHIVLAGYVVTICRYHLLLSNSALMGEQ